MAEQIVLVGQFQDNITGKLKKLSQELKNVSQNFARIQKRIRPITREMGKLAMATERVNDSIREQRSLVNKGSKSWSLYRREVGRAASSQRKAFRNVKPPPAPMSPRPGRTPRPTSTMGPVAAPPVGFGREAPGGREPLGIGGMTAAVFAGQAAFAAATSAFYQLNRAVRGAVSAGQQAEQAVINMAGTLQTLGGIGDYKASAKIATSMMKDLAGIAAALPGATGDYLTILQQTLDDQIQAFGSADKVTANLKQGERSFTALFGMSAQIAGLRPQLAAMDINQLRANPNSIRNIQLLTRNPTLQKYYLEELKKTGGDWFMALKTAMEKAITPEQINALKKSFDSAIQTLITSFNDAYSGVFGFMREVTLMNKEGMTEVTTAIKELGIVVSIINEIFDSVWKVVSGTNFDPMVMFVHAMRKLQGVFRSIATAVDNLISGEISVGDFAQMLGDFVGSFFAGLLNWVTNLDYAQFFKYVDEFVAGFVRGLIQGFRADADLGKGILTAFGTSLSGTITVIGLFVIAVNAATAALGKMALLGGLKGGAGAGAPGRRARSAERRNLTSSYLSGKPVDRATKTRAFFGRQGDKLTRGFAKVTKPLANLVKPLTKVTKAIPGGALVGGAVDMGIAIATGEDFGRAAAGTIGSVIGGAAGSIFGPAGTVIGTVAGGYLGDMVYDAFDPSAKDQVEAAKIQLQAAEAQRQLSQMGIDVGALSMGVEDPGKLFQVLDSLGLGDEPLSQYIMQNVGDLGALKSVMSQTVTQLEEKKAQLAALNFSPEQIAKNKDVTDLQAKISTLQEKIATKTKNINDAFDGLPKHIQEGVAKRLNTMSVVEIQEAIKRRVESMKINVNFDGSNLVITGGPITREQQLQNLFPIPPTPQTPQTGGSVLFPNLPYNPSSSYKGNFDTPLGEQLKKVGFAYKGSPLGKAIATEMKHKPVNSDLVIANSSETIIPAFSGMNQSRGDMTFNGGINITISGSDKTSESMANEIADQLLAAVKRASYTELDIT